jgi:hypothetical protein
MKKSKNGFEKGGLKERFNKARTRAQNQAMSAAMGHGSLIGEALIGASEVIYAKEFVKAVVKPSSKSRPTIFD